MIAGSVAKQRPANEPSPAVDVLTQPAANSNAAERTDPGGAPTDALTVLITTPTLDAGAADRSVVDLVRILTRSRHRALVVSQGGRLEDEIAAAGGEVVLLDMSSRNPLAIIRNGMHLARLARRRRCRLIHAHGRGPAWSAYLAARLTRLPFVTSWYKGFRQQNGLKKLYNGVMARGDRVIAVNDQIADLIAERHAASSDRVVVVPPSIDFAAFDPAAVAPARLEAVRAAWGISRDARVILVTGRMLRRKGHHVVVRAVQRLVQSGLQDFACVFIGEDRGRTRYAGEVWDLVLATNTAEVIRIAGPCADHVAAYAAATVVVSAAIQPEGLQRAILEALAMARPVVVSDLAAGPDVVQAPPLAPEERMSGLRVAAGDDAALAAALLRILSMGEDARRSMGARGRGWVLTHFDPDSAAEQILALYADLTR